MRRNWVEWTALAVSGAAIVALVGFLVVDGLTHPERRAVLAVVPRPAEAVGSTFQVPIRVRNDGYQSAENVDVEVVLKDGESDVDTGSVSIPFLPARSSVEAVVVFGEDPAKFRVEGRVLGYEVP